jgi:mannose-6-phosphate isomerase-like protein (cupin superfamily)
MKDGATGPRPVSTSTAAHYTWGAGCDGWHLVSRPGLSVIRERMPPGASESRHFHSAARQFFYVLSGSAVLEVEGVEFTLSADEGLEVAPGARHQLLNRSEAPLEFLVVSKPHSHGDKMLATT